MQKNDRERERVKYSKISNTSNNGNNLKPCGVFDFSITALLRYYYHYHCHYEWYSYLYFHFLEVNLSHMNYNLLLLYVIYYIMPLLHILYYNVLFLLPVLLPHVQFYYCTISSTCPISGGKACRESPASTTPHALFVPSRAAS